MLDFLPHLEAQIAHDHGMDVDTPEFANDLRRHTKKRIHELMKNVPCKKNHIHSLGVLDMDGTLYPHDGENNGFKNSTKERHLTREFITFIRAQEPTLTDSGALAIFNQALQNPIGPSVFLAKRYRMSRERIFSIIWNRLDADLIVGNPPYDASKVMKEIRERTCSVMLLTAAPAVWKRKVFKHLGLKDRDFDDILTTEEFTTKQDVFTEIGSLPKSFRGFSAGDSMSSDIEPAKAIGLATIHMDEKKAFSDIPRLLDTIE